jgi:hypothetical protein
MQYGYYGGTLCYVVQRWVLTGDVGGERWAVVRRLD